MTLTEFLRNQKDKSVWFYNEGNDLKNICYQDGVFFKIEKKREVRMMNPLRAVNVLNRINEGEIKFVSKGTYKNDIDIYKDYRKKKKSKITLSSVEVLDTKKLLESLEGDK